MEILTLLYVCQYRYQAELIEKTAVCLNNLLFLISAAVFTSRNFVASLVVWKLLEIG